MKTIILITIALFQFTAMAQTENFTGTYEKTIDTKSESISHQLTLNEDGSFEFKYSKNIHCAACPQESEKGKGKWKEKKGILTFKSKKKKDLNDDFIVNLNNTKAKIEERKVLITESDVTFLKGIVFEKQ